MENTTENGSSRVIGLPEYFAKYGEAYRNELTDAVRINAIKLLMRVNDLLWDVERLYGFETKNLVVTSGWRPAAANLKIANAAKRSAHITGEAVDLSGNALAKLLMDKHELLMTHKLWLENPLYTNTWTHLDMRERDSRKIRVFSP